MSSKQTTRCNEKHNEIVREHNEIVRNLKSLGSKKNILGMARFGINPKGTLGVSMPKLRGLAKKIGKNHPLALSLWKTGIHEAKILAGLVGEAEKLAEKEMDLWVKGFDSWDVCDQVCMNLFDKTKFAEKKIFELASRKEEFVKRTAFALIASLSVHSKKMADKEFVKFFPLIKKASTDERNFVRKAVNWALRQIGKRNLFLNRKAIELAYQIKKNNPNSKAAKWIANNALTELEGKAVQRRLRGKD